MDSDFIANAPDDYLVLMTSLNSGGDARKALMLADLLDMEAKAYEMRGDYAQSEMRYLKALNVLTQVALQLTHAPMADHLGRISNMRRRCKTRIRRCRCAPKIVSSRFTSASVSSPKPRICCMTCWIRQQVRTKTRRLARVERRFINACCNTTTTSWKRVACPCRGARRLARAD